MARGWLRYGLWALAALSLAFAGVQIRLHRQPAHKVLIIHSYNTDMPWVGDVDQGIRRAAAGSAMKVELRHHYMNLLNHPDCNYFRLSAEDARAAIADWDPDSLILVDDLAQALVGFPSMRLKADAPVAALRESIVAQLTAQRCAGKDASAFGLDHASPLASPRPIFFAGVNSDVERYGYDYAEGVSGIFEHKNIAALAETLNAVNNASPVKAKAVQLLNDASATARSENSRYASAHWGALQWLEPRNVSSFDEWQVVVREASARKAMLLVANYQNVRDGIGGLVPPGELIAWTEQHSLYPVIGAGTSFVSDGGLMTLAISGAEQGEAAMEMVLEYAATGKMPPRRTAQQVLVGMNPALARKRKLELAAIDKEFARELGRFMDVSPHLYRDAGAGGKP